MLKYQIYQSKLAGTEKQQIAMRSTLPNTYAWRFHQSI